MLPYTSVLQLYTRSTLVLALREEYDPAAGCVFWTDSYNIQLSLSNDI